MPEDTVPAEAIYTAHYSYRKTSVLVMSLFLLVVFGAGCLAFVVSACVPGRDWSTRGGSLLSALFVGAFAGMGWWLLRAWMKRKTLDLAISVQGVSYGGRSFPWDVVRELRLTRFDDRGQLTLLRRGFTAHVKLITDTGISSREYEVLMSILDQMVAPLHNHLRFTR